MQPQLLDLAVIPVALFLSMLVNRIVAYFITPLFVRQKWDRQWIMYLAAVIGFALAWFAQINLLPMIFPDPMVGRIVTGVIIGGGANFLHDLIKALGGAFGGTMFSTEEMSFESGSVRAQDIAIQPSAPASGESSSVNIQVTKEP